MEATASTTEAIEIRSSMKFLDTSPRGVLAGSALNVVRAASAWLRSLGKKRQPRDGAQKGSGDSGGALKSLARSAKDEAQPSASGSNQLEPQVGGSAAAHQLQGATLKDPAVWYCSDRESSQVVGGSIESAGP